MPELAEYNGVLLDLNVKHLGARWFFYGVDRQLLMERA